MDNLHLLNNKPKKDNSRGFYIALGVCLIAIGVAAWTTYDSVVNYAAPNEGTVSSKQVQHTNEAVSGIKVYEEESSEPAPVISSEPAPKVKEEVSKAPVTPPSKVPAKRTEAKVLTFTSPVEKNGYPRLQRPESGLFQNLQGLARAYRHGFCGEAGGYRKGRRGRYG